LAVPHEALVASVLESDAINVDETGWSTAGAPRTLSTATSKRAAIFRIAQDRHRDRLDDLLRDYEGIVCSDRWWAYDHLDPDCRQACWQHLKRDFLRHAEGLGEQKTFGNAGLALTHRLFAAWRAFAEHQDRSRLARETRAIQQELRALLERAGRKSTCTRFHRVFANKLLKIRPALWAFASVEGVEPTNNAAERSLRGPVIHRKLSHGSQSEQGERFIERVLSASVTCRLQGRSLFAYLESRPRSRRPPPHARLSWGLNAYLRAPARTSWGSLVRAQYRPPHESPACCPGIASRSTMAPAASSPTGRTPYPSLIGR
jgi:transposase